MCAALVLSTACCSPIEPTAAAVAPQEGPEKCATSLVVPFDATAPPTDGEVGAADRRYEVQTYTHRGRFDPRPAPAATDPCVNEDDAVDDFEERGGRDPGAATIVERSDLFRSPRPAP